MRFVMTTALLLALGSATAASAGPVAIDSGLVSAGQAPIEQVQYYYGPGPYYAPAPYAPAPYYYGAPYYGPAPYYYGPAAVGAAVGGLVGGAVAGAAGAVAGAPAAAVAAPGAVVAAPGEPVIDVAYCQRRFRSYDVRSQTYMGSDGVRHPCPN
jgi:BA14K-like protein